MKGVNQMLVETFENEEIIETADLIPQSSMKLFIAAVEEKFKDPEEQRKFEEWKKLKPASHAKSAVTAGSGQEAIHAESTRI